LSRNLRERIEAQFLLEVEGEIDVTWDDCGNLVSPFGVAQISV
jgi:hypothetical protein